MGKQIPELEEQHIKFIAAQKLFFVGTATADSRINVSPKGMDSFRVLGPNRVIWLNVTGSGNETSAHIQQDGRMTVMFCAFTGKPLILRLYGQARVIHPYDADWDELFAHFPSIPGARQVFDLSVDLVQTSCGMAVPYFDYVEEREQLKTWASKQGEAGLHQYWYDRNQQSLDGIPTHILEEE
ncbi:pyridoxamine 5'-phosphate oxidase family protein [Gimesia maris]|uniref:Pyridoxamine 5'-phosphate oxidase n=1 Tax=Gimesia maris TaxID=122 RepID=A0ABX5YVZ3_9PLAN|nr:pyridoxamine 5'-phosphate oxidase family protein [Gimesia maris]EDL56254.1 Signal transduction histidine kinase, nitrogen specific [Gimesia maris DSM 8797]QEG19805.1 Pyridoxamine 5'-phosphate oxidase [Gimesia maris]QGQ27376.1 pyridoxamine 5'-phosphate oxidase family protein [Gimesia maris]